MAYYNFNPNLPEPFNAIHPYQVNSVLQFIGSCLPDCIDYIFLFGSSLDLTCNITSDLDFYVITQSEDIDNVYALMHTIGKSLKKRFDILISSLEIFLERSKEIGTVESKIMEKGVIIYAKG